MSKYTEIMKKFKDGDYVVGIGEHKGCSQVFTDCGQTQPFSYLSDYNPDNYRLATEDERAKADNDFSEHLAKQQ